MPTDPYGRDNPLGPRGILTSYSSTLTAIETGRADSLLVATQQSLDLTGIDAGLAVTVAAHQRDLKQLSYQFGELVEPDFVHLTVELSNLVELLKAADQSHRAPADAELCWQGVTETLKAVADSTGETLVSADAAVDRLTSVNAEIDRVSKRLDVALKLAQDSLAAEAKQTLARVEELTRKISENIQAIVDGALATGDAFTDFGIGLLTTITKGLPDDDKKPDDKKDDGDKKDDDGDSGDGESDDDADAADAGGADSDDGVLESEALLGSLSAAEKSEATKDAGTKNSDGKVPDVSFVVSAIKAGFKGTEKYASALKDLQANNDELAIAYQAIAAVDLLIAVASATQAQKNLFATSMQEALTAVTGIRDGWAAVHAGYEEWSHTDDRTEFARLQPGAMAQWNKLTAEAERIKRHLTHVRGARLV
ncbi:hypothetical protein [Aestuariimicrobium sp. Y1814]|uniref:hypothetical protein n=1 Tax=Aestuariimicrobium sp. Y1814 TaxID=3418742 RepID=UPI003DA75FC5